jgi:hypothetical protein
MERSLQATSMISMQQWSSVSRGNQASAHAIVHCAVPRATLPSMRAAALCWLLTVLLSWSTFHARQHFMADQLVYPPCAQHCSPDGRPVLPSTPPRPICSDDGVSMHEEYKETCEKNQKRSTGKNRKENDSEQVGEREVIAEDDEATHHPLTTSAFLHSNLRTHSVAATPHPTSKIVVGCFVTRLAEQQSVLVELLDFMQAPRSENWIQISSDAVCADTSVSFRISRVS